MNLVLGSFDSSQPFIKAIWTATDGSSEMVALNFEATGESIEYTTFTTAEYEELISSVPGLSPITQLTSTYVYRLPYVLHAQSLTGDSYGKVLIDNRPFTYVPLIGAMVSTEIVGIGDGSRCGEVVPATIDDLLTVDIYDKQDVTDVDEVETVGIMVNVQVQSHAVRGYDVMFIECTEQLEELPEQLYAIAEVGGELMLGTLIHELDSNDFIELLYRKDTSNKGFNLLAVFDNFILTPKDETLSLLSARMEFKVGLVEELPLLDIHMTEVEPSKTVDIEDVEADVEDDTPVNRLVDFQFKYSDGHVLKPCETIETILSNIISSEQYRIG